MTGASQGIGAGIANLFLDRGYNVVANSRRISQKNELQRSDRLVTIDGDIALAATADKLVAAALERFGSIDALVNNAGIFFAKPFAEYTVGGLPRAFGDEPRRLPAHHPARHQADARAAEPAAAS